MAIDFETEREQVHALLDQLPPAKLSAVRRLLEVLVGDDAEELTAADRLAIQAGLLRGGDPYPLFLNRRLDGGASHRIGVSL